MMLNKNHDMTSARIQPCSRTLRSRRRCSALVSRAASHCILGPPVGKGSASRSLASARRTPWGSNSDTPRLQYSPSSPWNENTAFRSKGPEAPTDMPPSPILQQALRKLAASSLSSLSAITKSDFSTTIGMSHSSNVPAQPGRLALLDFVSSASAQLLGTIGCVLTRGSQCPESPIFLDCRRQGALSTPGGCLVALFACASTIPASSLFGLVGGRRQGGVLDL